jgi:hypothetical protein
MSSKDLESNQGSNKAGVGSEEYEPLLQKSGQAKGMPSPRAEMEMEDKVISYDANSLAVPWATFLNLPETIFMSHQVWLVMGKLTLWALVVGLGIVFCVEHPENMETAHFATISAFLKVFVAFLLGFFMTSSVGRWGATVQGFLILVNAVKNLQMQLLALGVPSEKMAKAVRYGVLSMGYLIEDFEIEDLKADEMVEEVQKRNEQRLRKNFLHEQEVRRLSKVDDKASLLWIWVASYMAHLAETGDIPPMASPTYGRIIALCQDGQVGIRTVRSAVGVQMPFVYVHLLATMVHVNNVLCATALGLIIGVELSALFAKYGVYGKGVGEAQHGAGDIVVPDSVRGQKILIACLTQGLAPFMYQAFLQIALGLSHPFGPFSVFARIPTNVWLRKLRNDLEQAEQMAADPPGWKTAAFKKP